MSKPMFNLSLVTATAAALLVSSQAFAAGPEACGGIELTSIGECHFEFDGGCEGQCNASVDASCTGSCNADCQAACEANPGAFDCRAECTADCYAGVEAHCGTGDEECRSYYEASCSAECEGQCEVVPPSASCEAECNACCSGTCEVDAEFSCALECSAELQGGCEYDCRQPSGALFCDGQYLAVQDMPACLEYLAENFNVELQAEASASATLSCSTSEPGGDSGAGWALLAGLGLAGVVVARGRKNGRKT